MGYLRGHKWIRRVVLCLLAIVIGMSAALVLWPMWMHHSILKKLSSPKPQVRAAAVETASNLALNNPKFCRKLENSLICSGDVHFFSAATALAKAGLFDTPSRSAEDHDYMSSLLIENYINDYATVEHEVYKLLTSGRTNSLIVKAARACLESEDEKIRQFAPALAGLSDNKYLYRDILDSPSESLQAQMLRYCGLAIKSEFADKIISKLDSPNPDVRSAAVFALMQMDFSKYLPHIQKTLDNERDPRALDIMLLGLAYSGSAPAKDAADRIISEALESKTPLLAGHIRLIGKFKLAKFRHEVIRILAAAFDEKSRITTQQLHAALLTADKLRLPIRGHVYHICRDLWSMPQMQLMMVDAAEILGRQIALEQDSKVTADECMELLVRAANFEDTPVASAAAAVAYWMNEPADWIFKVPDNDSLKTQAKVNRSGALILQACSADNTLAGDYVAWKLAQSGRPLAFELGLKLLPPPNAKTFLKVYNENARAAGAMLLALSAKTPQQKQRAIQRIESRLMQDGLVIEDSIILADVYRCGLLALGHKKYATQVRAQLQQGTNPLRSAITALLACGDEKIVEWIMCNREIPIEDIVGLMVNFKLGEVFAKYQYHYLTSDLWDARHVRLFQGRLMRARFVLSRRHAAAVRRE